MEYPVKIVPNPRPLFSFKKRGLNYYGSILEAADVNVHEQITNLLNKMYPDHAIRILDIASGKGALALRIKDSREKKFNDDIVTVDIIEPDEPLKFTYWQIDLNNDEQFEELVDEYRGYFDVILGIETIEHLENPKMYLYYLKEMLNDNGHIFISTPSITNPMARRIFYKKGRLEQFSEQDLQYGHISIILPHLLDKMASDLKLKLMIEYPLGLYPKFWLYPDKRSLYITLCNLRMLRVRGSWCKLYIFKKDDIDAE
jgi:hypothetical protein